MYRKAIALLAITLLLTLPVSVYKDAYGYAVEEVPCATYNETDECLHWDKTDLTYHVKNLATDSDYKEYVYDAFEEWQTETGGLFNFTKITKRWYKADIIVIIVGDNIEKHCIVPDANGCAWSYSNKATIKQIRIYLADRLCMSGKFLHCINTNPTIFKKTAEHEIGHGLGLDHVKDNGIVPIDMMYHMATELKEISKADIKTLNKIYGRNINHAVNIVTAPYDLFEDKPQFVPSEIRIRVGDTITWKNMDYNSEYDRGRHTVTSGSAHDESWGTVFDSGKKLLKPGDSYSYTFNEAGTYPYLCALHPWMSGKVIVE